MTVPTSELTCWTVARAAAAGTPADQEELDALGQAYSRLGRARLGRPTAWPPSATAPPTRPATSLTGRLGRDPHRRLTAPLQFRDPARAPNRLSEAWAS